MWRAPPLTIRRVPPVMQGNSGMTDVTPAEAGSENGLDAAAPKLRADAARNRAKLVSTARDVFTAEGGQTSLEQIAKAAGVGIGTLYRHFPTRLDLLEA